MSSTQISFASFALVQQAAILCTSPTATPYSSVPAVVVTHGCGSDGGCIDVLSPSDCRHLSDVYWRLNASHAGEWSNGSMVLMALSQAHGGPYGEFTNSERVQAYDRLQHFAECAISAGCAGC